MLPLPSTLLWLIRPLHCPLDMIYCPTSFEPNTLSTYPTHVKLIRHHPLFSRSATPYPPPTTLLTRTSGSCQKTSAVCKKVLARFSSTVLLCPAVTKAVDNWPTPIGRTARNQAPEQAMVAAAPGSQEQDLQEWV